MSDQQPPQGYPPQPGQPYAYQPPKQKKTLRNVLIVLGVLGVLFCGGCLAVTGVFVNEVDKAIEEEEANDQPTTIGEGKAFTHDDYKADAGWTVAKDGLGGVTIEGLKVTNEADDARTALLTFRFYQGTENLAEVECSSNEIANGESNKLSCVSFDGEFPKGYDTIKVADAF